jgi:hypothetical protein
MSESSAKVDAPARSGAANLEAYAGEWVVLQDERVIADGPDLPQIVQTARSRGIPRPRVLFVERSRARHAVKLGL